MTKRKKKLNKTQKIVATYKAHADKKITRGQCITRLRKLSVPLSEIRYMLDGSF